MSKRLNAEIHCSSTKPTDAETSHSFTFQTIFSPVCRLDNANTNTEERRQFKERRKLLKLQLDNRRSNMLRNITNSNNISSSNSTTSLTNDLQNTPSSTPFTAEQIVQDPYKGVSKYYLDHGDHNSKKATSTSSDSLDTEIIEYLKVMLDSNNQLVKTYRRARDRFFDNPHVDLKLRLKAKRTKDGRTYNLPTSSEVAALIVGDIEDALDNRDVIVDSKKDGLQRISELHPSYITLQYPLLFPFGKDGYRIDILHKEGTSSKKRI
ncbi:uncharacterized protein LOC118488221 [Helianthus annuus]|uniref:uncharacterized protein LOC118488221 n=1 Tax=Helianthus annuus TaxID=4232 RepID=UPI0016532B77|nr:uncharacterized protein LOC118488221 [Helianthus annuus]